jgi:hypothetical protein
MKKIKVIEPKQEEPTFEIGNLVRLKVENNNDIYSYDIPECGSYGFITEQTHQLALEQLFGIKVPMSIVEWDNGDKCAVYSHDLKKVF